MIGAFGNQGIFVLRDSKIWGLGDLVIKVSLDWMIGDCDWGIVGLGDFGDWVIAWLFTHLLYCIFDIVLDNSI